MSAPSKFTDSISLPRNTFVVGVPTQDRGKKPDLTKNWIDGKYGTWAVQLLQSPAPSELNPESALFWRVKVDFLAAHAEGKSDIDEVLDVLVPNLTALAGLIAAQAEDSDDHPGTADADSLQTASDPAIDEELSFESAFLVKQAALLARQADWTDEAGRSQLLSCLQNLLFHPAPSIIVPGQRGNRRSMQQLRKLQVANECFRYLPVDRLDRFAATVASLLFPSATSPHAAIRQEALRGLGHIAVLQPQSSVAVHGPILLQALRADVPACQEVAAKSLGDLLCVAPKESLRSVRVAMESTWSTGTATTPETNEAVHDPNQDGMPSWPRIPLESAVLDALCRLAAQGFPQDSEEEDSDAEDVEDDRGAREPSPDEVQARMVAVEVILRLVYAGLPWCHDDEDDAQDEEPDSVSMGDAWYKRGCIDPVTHRADLERILDLLSDVYGAEDCFQANSLGEALLARAEARMAERRAEGLEPVSDEDAEELAEEGETLLRRGAEIRQWLETFFPAYAEKWAGTGEEEQKDDNSECV